MQFIPIIRKKKQGLELEDQEIDFLVEAYTKGNIPDYQMSAFLMAVCLKGMSDRETARLTMAMAHSGDLLDLSSIPGIKVDKHSTGGIGDKTTLIVGPIVSSLGIRTAKMSGRGLGATGGTIDKLDSIPGFSSDLSDEEFLKNLKEVGFVDAGQTKNLAPADKKIYALRDVTGTVDSIPLIASSIMSKKIASGADAIVLDVKCGSGAFMQNPEDAKRLAKTMIEIGKNVGRKVTAIVTDMNEPLGNTVGNSLEVMEAVDFLKGKKEGRLYEVVKTLSCEMVRLGNDIEFRETSQEFNDMFSEISPYVDRAIDSGKALEQFRKFVLQQGGNPAFIDDYSLLPAAKYMREVRAQEEGYLSSCNAEMVGQSSMILGAGRESLTDQIDYGAGVRVNKHLGDYVNKGDLLATLYSNKEDRLQTAEELFLSAYELSPDKPALNPVVMGIYF